MVKFRDEEEMQLLTANRQSGGERAVCTILYIIALQVNAALLDHPVMGSPALLLAEHCSIPMGHPGSAFLCTAACRSLLSTSTSSTRERSRTTSPVLACGYFTYHVAKGVLYIALESGW